MKDLNQLMHDLGYVFTDISLFERALTHRSVASKNNERLEFLGDAILSFIIAAELFQRHCKAKEGELSRLRSILVNGDILAKLAKNLGLNGYIRLGAGELKSGGQNRDSILADALEAVIGAIYLDGGIDACRRCVMGWYGKMFDDISAISPKKDAKSKLQEWLQAHKYSLPIYELKITGAAHAQIFHITCSVPELKLSAEGTSSSRRRAEQEAAQKFLDLINE